MHGCYHDVEDKLRDIKIADSFEENECLSSVYVEAGGKTAYQNLLQNFDGEFSVAHLTLSAGTNVNGNAVTKAPSNYNIEIMFNTNRLNRPELSVARTLMHELVHAEMFRKLLSVAQAPDLNYPGYTLEDWRNYVTNLKDDYPGLYDYYFRYEWGVSSGENPTSAQHQAMAEHYRDLIEDALREFNGSLTDEIYEALAWQGLKNTVAWNNLSYSEKYGIENTILNFENSNPPCQ